MHLQTNKEIRRGAITVTVITDVNDGLRSLAATSAKFMAISPKRCKTETWLLQKTIRKTSSACSQLKRVTDGQTVRQTDGKAISIAERVYYVTVTRSFLSRTQIVCKCDCSKIYR